MRPADYRRWRRWREQWNPLRHLTIAKAVTLQEQAQRGEHAEVQWAYRIMERRFAVLSALVERRLAAITQMDWDVHQAAPTVAGYDATLAAEQRSFLRGYYEQVGNLYEAIAHLALAPFRGFSLLERADTELLPVDHWHLVQDGLRPRWKYNPAATLTTWQSMPPEAELPQDRIVAVVHERPIDELALILFVRAALADKDWDAWCEVYGIPGGVVIGPPNVPDDKEAAYAEAAAAIADGGNGYLPHGSTYEPNDSARGMQPFEARLRWIQEQLVLAGTGGLLTMLASPTGIGQGATGAHADAFAAIARGDARRISEAFQRGVDRHLLSAVWPDQPVLAYWSLAAREEVDGGEVVVQVTQLGQAGYVVDAAQVEEKTGYRVTRAAVPPAAGPATPISAPTAAVEGAAAQGDVQGTALNGAQVAALMDLATAVAQRQIPMETAKAIAGAAFPLIGADVIHAAFAPLDQFMPQAPAAGPIANRAAAEGQRDTREAAAAAMARDLAPLRGRMAVILRQLADPAADLTSALEEGLRLLKEAGPDVLAGDALARELEAALQAAVIEGASRSRSPS